MASGNRGPSLSIYNDHPSSLKAKLADFLTLSRAVLGVVILSLSLVGRDAYLTVVLLVILGGITDILDGRAARRFLGGEREGRLGKHDLEIDTFFVLCALAYFSISGIIVPTAVGLGWIGLAVVAIAVYRGKPKILLIFEVPAILALIVSAGLYDLRVFLLIVLPALFAGTVINHKRIRYQLFENFPRYFSQ